MKIFCIGFQKTGTSSMGMALERLGFSVAGVQCKHDPHLETALPRLIENVVPLFDAFQDNPWPILYRTLDQAFPESKFILTLRDENSWLRSIVRHCEGRSTSMRKWIYGYGNPVGHEDAYLNVYRNHNKDVKDYFKERVGRDYLVMNLFEGDEWGKLCPFLEISDVPRSIFPHLNRASDRKVLQRLRRKLRPVRHKTEGRNDNQS